ncbi:MAG: putative Rossmann fold flavoprotein [Acidimicrobiales bacterium]|jgi:predicted Rossmann fold flavoprotein
MSTNREHIGAHYDVIVIGGGASGMMAAGRAAERGKRVLLVDKNKQLGKKLSTTGGGRCNILNAETDTRKLLDKYGDAAKFLHSPFAQHGMEDSREFFESRGLPIVVEARKRAFPESQDATDVTQLLKTFVGKNGVTLRLSTKVQGFIKDDDGKLIGIETSRESFSGDSFILATGGSAKAETGASSEGVEWLTEFGHKVFDPNPNIVPLKVDEQWVKDISGVTLSFMKITFSDHQNSKKTRFSRTGKILFTHFGLSGPLILNAAHEVKKLLHHGHVNATIDMYPDTDIGTLRNRVLEVFNINKNKELRNVLKEFVPHGMTDAVAAQLDKDLQTMRVHSVGKEERHELVERLKAMPVTITGTMGLDWAVISDGGVEVSEVDTKTMRSKKIENLYLTGDVLHVNRPSGGFSLQLCWTTGWVAGNSV